MTFDQAALEAAVVKKDWLQASAVLLRLANRHVLVSEVFFKIKFIYFRIL